MAQTANVRRNYSYPFTVNLYVEECCACGMVFAMPSDWQQVRRRQRDTFHCPAGHAQHYTGKTPEQQQRERAEQAEAAAAAERRRATQAEEAARYQRRRVAALRGHLTRMRNRIAAGVCPVPGCQRTGLTQTLRHIRTKHPDWLHDHPEVSE